jgi:hypothetical protein
MNMKKYCIKLIVIWLILVAGCMAQGQDPADANTPVITKSVAQQEINVQRLSDADRVMVEKLLDELSLLIKERRQKSNLATLTFEELYAPLDDDEKVFIKRFQSIDPNLLDLNIPFQGIVKEAPELVIIKGQKIKTADNKTSAIPPQFLPKEVHEAYQAMAAAMKKDIGKTLYVESGYRSAAYQLYLFISYLKNHQYSARETARFSAWPGYSEHGWPEHQAIDFVSERGINSQSNPKVFEALDEYRWLTQHAGEYGFELSYPKDSKMAFEPWHWRYNKMINDK